MSVDSYSETIRASILYYIRAVMRHDDEEQITAWMNFIMNHASAANEFRPSFLGELCYWLDKILYSQQSRQPYQKQGEWRLYSQIRYLFHDSVSPPSSRGTATPCYGLTYSQLSNDTRTNQTGSRDSQQEFESSRNVEDVSDQDEGENQECRTQPESESSQHSASSGVESSINSREARVRKNKTSLTKNNAETWKTIIAKRTKGSNNVEDNLTAGATLETPSTCTATIIDTNMEHKIVKFDKNKDTWVMCTECGTWRKIPYPGREGVKDDWKCSNNTTDPLRNTCAAEEERCSDREDSPMQKPTHQKMTQDHTHSQDSIHSDQPSSYERQRDETVKRNALVMEELLQSSKSSVADHKVTQKRTSIRKSAGGPPARQSKRLREKSEAPINEPNDSSGQQQQTGCESGRISKKSRSGILSLTHNKSRHPNLRRPVCNVTTSEPSIATDDDGYDSEEEEATDINETADATTSDTSIATGDDDFDGEEEVDSDIDETAFDDDCTHRPTRPTTTQTIETILAECRSIFEYLIEEKEVFNHMSENIDGFTHRTFAADNNGWVYFYEGKGIGSTSCINKRKKSGGYKEDKLTCVVNIDSIPEKIDLELQSRIRTMMESVIQHQLPTNISEVANNQLPLAIQIMFKIALDEHGKNLSGLWRRLLLFTLESGAQKYHSLERFRSSMHEWLAVDYDE